ncbi:hypothetical protein K439DRAFT_1625374 [Ramaria rubella]|nr:hypothetical protein K439DRAFT_1625374 [Ramaria rubella]
MDDATAMDAVENDSTTSTDDDTATATSTAAGSATPAPATALTGTHLYSGMAAIENAIKVTEAKLQQFLALCWVKYVKAKTEPLAVHTNCRQLEKTHLGDLELTLDDIKWAIVSAKKLKIEEHVCPILDGIR